MSPNCLLHDVERSFKSYKHYRKMSCFQSLKKHLKKKRVKPNRSISNYHYQIVLAVKARGAKVAIQKVGMESWESVEVVLHPLKDISHGVIVASSRGGVHVHRLEE